MKHQQFKNSREIEKLIFREEKVKNISWNFKFYQYLILTEISVNFFLTGQLKLKFFNQLTS